MNDPVLVTGVSGKVDEGQMLCLRSDSWGGLCVVIAVRHGKPGLDAAGGPDAGMWGHWVHLLQTTI